MKKTMETNLALSQEKAMTPPHNKGMQSDHFTRYASKMAADAGRYVANQNRKGGAL